MSIKIQIKIKKHLLYPYLTWFAFLPINTMARKKHNHYFLLFSHLVHQTDCEPPFGWWDSYAFFFPFIINKQTERWIDWQKMKSLVRWGRIGDAYSNGVAIAPRDVISSAEESGDWIEEIAHLRFHLPSLLLPILVLQMVVEAISEVMRNSYLWVNSNLSP